jgi:hypothetical protein
VRVAHVQVDILARSPDGVLTVVEVKMASALAGVSWRQRRRLARVALVLAEYGPVELMVALVSGDEVQVVPL